MTAAEIVSLIQQGKCYINIHSVTYPAGEIRGNFSLVFGSQTPPTPIADPGYDPSTASTDAGAARFLNHATFGASPADVASVKANGYAAWLDNQFTLPATHLVPEVLANVNSDPTNLYPSTLTFNAWWRKSITAPDQLRQRVAFALSEILVVSDVGTLNNNGRALASYYDTLLDGAFGNFRELLEQVTLTPAMGLYLDMRANQKGSLLTGLHPNENYPREIMQLFSLGLNRLWPDGTLVLDSGGNLIAVLRPKSHRRRLPRLHRLELQPAARRRPAPDQFQPGRQLPRPDGARPYAPRTRHQARPRQRRPPRGPGLQHLRQPRARQRSRSRRRSRSTPIA